MEPNPLADLVGPCYEPNTAATGLGCPVEDLPERAEGGGLLALRTSDGVPVYPAFQFTITGTLRPELLPVLTVLAEVPRWSAAVWLRTSNTDLDGRSPEQALADGAAPDLVRTLAGHWVGIVHA